MLEQPEDLIQSAHLPTSHPRKATYPFPEKTHAITASGSVPLFTPTVAVGDTLSAGRNEL